MYVPNNRAAKYVKQKQIKLKNKIDKSSVTVKDINPFLSTIDRTVRQKISMDLEELNNIIN